MTFINRYWVDLRTCGVYIIDSFIKDEYNPSRVAAFWEAIFDVGCGVYYVPLEFETNANRICEKMNKTYNQNQQGES